MFFEKLLWISREMAVRCHGLPCFLRSGKAIRWVRVEVDGKCASSSPILNWRQKSS